MLDEIEQIFSARLPRPEDQTVLRLPPDEAALLLLVFTHGLVVIKRVYQDKTKLFASVNIFMNLLFGHSTSNDG